jgi:ABC-type dipeptide/oligopeptide/nickel transport system ATPase subunit
MAAQSAPKPDALKPLIDATSIGKMIGTITSANTAESIRAKAVWQEAGIQALGEKETALARLKAASPQTLRDALSGRKRQIATVRDSTKSVAEATSETKVSEIKVMVADLLKLENAVEVAAKATFGDLNFPGIGGEVWRELLLAAAKYSTTVVSPGNSFPAPEADTKCVLCLQPLDVGARDRLTRFWAFIEDDVSNKRNQAKSALAAEAGKLSKLPRKLPKEIEMLEETLRAAGSTIFEKAKSFYAAANSRIEAVELAIGKNSWDQIPAEPASLVQDCDDEISGIEKELHAIVDDQKLVLIIKTLSEEIAELNARKRLSENLDSVLNHLNALKIAAKATAAGNKITTNGISAKASDLQTKFVTEAFKRKVQEELKPLNLTRVRTDIDKKSEKGKVLHKLMIDGAGNVPLDNVFSEGERTALSLSCFLAELSASDDNCGIIFDDPVSSLDHRVRGAIVKRLVAEAAVRQIIIFTHDLVFHRELVASSEEQKIAVEFQNVEALGSTTGILTSIPPWPVTKISQRTAFLEQVLKKAKDAEQNADVAAYKSMFHDFYGSLRSTWERSVEELLFNQVVQRYEKEVSTLRLSGVSVDTESVQTIFKGMTRSSAMIDAHDHPAAENPGLPGSAELSGDLEEFKAFVLKQKAKNKAAEKAHEHLK